MNKNIFGFLKYCLGNEVDMSGVVAGMDWRQLFAFSSKQAILGFCFEGIERLGKEYPSLLKENPVGEDLVMVWMGKAMQIRRKNMKLNVTAGKLYRQLREDGLRCCILKGQGMAKKYFLKIWRNMHFVRYYPAEALCEPVFRTWHFFWRVSQTIVTKDNLSRHIYKR